VCRGDKLDVAFISFLAPRAIFTPRRYKQRGPLAARHVSNVANA